MSVSSSLPHVLDHQVPRDHTQAGLAWLPDTALTLAASSIQFVPAPSPVTTPTQSHASSLHSHRQSLDPQPCIIVPRIAPGRADLDKTIGQDGDALVNLFYANFHAAHPFLVPRAMFADQNYPNYLRKVVQLIGSQYSEAMSNHTLRDVTGAALDEAGRQPEKQSLHLVQARLLFSIALHARNEIKESVSVLAMAVSLALEIGLDKKEYCAKYEAPSRILAESVRRTWWELYVTDGFTAALQRKTSFLCHTAMSDVPLPCDENAYVEGRMVLGEPPSMAQFEARIFSEEDLVFSSFCYRIEAVKVLAKVLAISSTQEIEEEQVQAIETTLAAWPHHLPPGKTSALGITGEMDEMLFQAHMLIQYTIIYLHFPRSHLVATVPATSDIIRQRHLVPFSTRNIHGVKAIEASKQLGSLAALHAPVTKHTPFFVFAIVFGAIVQLSALSQAVAGPREHCRDRISLIIGVLKTVGPIWQFSQAVMCKLRRIAAEVLSINPTTSLQDGNAEARNNAAEPPWPASLSAVIDMDWMDFLETDFFGQ